MSGRLGEKVLGWLEAMRLEREEVENPKARLHLVVEFPRESGHRLDLIFPEEEEDLLLVGCVVPLSEDLQKAMGRMKRKEREAVIWDLRYSFSFMPVGFHLTHPGGVLQKFAVSAGVYADGLTKHALMRTMTEVHKTKVLGIWILHRRLGGREPEEPETVPTTDMYV
jgi:hypothetical protein